MSLKSKMPFQVWILTLSAFSIGMAEFVIAGLLPQVAAGLRVPKRSCGNEPVGSLSGYEAAMRPKPLELPRDCSSMSSSVSISMTSE